VQADGEIEEYYVVPEEALPFLPEEWRAEFREKADDGKAVLKSVDNDLKKLARLSNSFGTLVALKHIQKRLSEYRFAADMEAVLELDMLTTAFVVTYVRLHHGGSGTGFSRGELPDTLRETHDNILEIRNKRFAHNDAHHSVSNEMQIGFDGARFHIKFSLSLGYHVGGANEWHELVRFLDNLFAEKLGRQLAKLRDKTGLEWVAPSGPGPE